MGGGCCRTLRLSCKHSLMSQLGEKKPLDKLFRRIAQRAAAVLLLHTGFCNGHGGFTGLQRYPDVALCAAISELEVYVLITTPTVY